MFGHFKTTQTFQSNFFVKSSHNATVVQLLIHVNQITCIECLLRKTKVALKQIFIVYLDSRMRAVARLLINRLIIYNLEHWYLAIHVQTERLLTVGSSLIGGLVISCDEAGKCLVENWEYLRFCNTKFLQTLNWNELNSIWFLNISWRWFAQAWRSSTHHRM